MRGVVLATRRRTLPPGDDGRNTDGRVRLPWFAEDIQSPQESLLTDRKRQATFVVTTEAYDQRVYTARFEMCERPSDAPDLVRCARGT
jgi:hypothetical protein